MAILGTLLVTFGLSYVGGALFETETPATPGYVIAVEEPESETQTAGAAGAAGGESGPAPIAARLASADIEAGQSTARQCAACHNFQKGEGNKIGPVLWDVVNREVAAVEGFNYTEAMREFAETEGTWTYEHLDTYLADPKGLVPGTTMNFSGVKDAENRANVIAYLHTLSDDPAPLPEGGAAPAAETESAGGEQAGTETQTPASDQAEQAATSETESAQPAGEVAEETAQSAVESGATETPAPAQQQSAEQQPAEQQQAAAEQPAEPQAAEPAAQPQASAPATGGGEEDPELMAMIAAAEPEAGQRLTSQCKACHTFEKGGPNRIGPNLWGIVGRQVAAHEGFKYTDAMQQYGEEIGGTWTYSHLSTYLADPRGEVPGTKMIFQGVKKKEDRAALLAYLNTLADNPQPLPGQ